MILVTLGTHPMPMDRVVRAVDEWISTSQTDEEVIIQSASWNVQPERANQVSVVDFEQLQAWVREARVVVCHGGPATIMQVLASGKVPIVIPRDPIEHEHVDDHQQRFVRWLAMHRPIVPLWSLAELPASIEEAQRRAASDHESGAADVVRRLNELVDDPATLPRGPSASALG